MMYDGIRCQNCITDDLALLVTRVTALAVDSSTYIRTVVFYNCLLAGNRESHALSCHGIWGVGHPSDAFTGLDNG